MDQELVRVLQMLDTLKLDWGDQYLTYYGLARGDNGFKVQAHIGVIEDFSDPSIVADFSAIYVTDPSNERIFTRRYLSNRLHSFAEEYDPESEHHLRNWIRNRLADATKLADKRREEYLKKFWD